MPDIRDMETMLDDARGCEADDLQTAEGIAFTASKLSCEKLDAEGRRAAVMIEVDLNHEECAVALAAAIARLHT